MKLPAREWVYRLTYALIERAMRRQPDFIRDDDDRALHDHPWPSVSVLLLGSYIEVLPAAGQRQPAADDHAPNGLRYVKRHEGQIVARGAEARHRIVLLTKPDGTPDGCWTLFITGPVTRWLTAWRSWRATGYPSTWGFHCRQGFVPWRQFVDARDKGRTGAGCGEQP